MRALLLIACVLLVGCGIDSSSVANLQPPTLLPLCEQSEMRLWAQDCAKHCIPESQAQPAQAVTGCYKGIQEYGRLVYFTDDRVSDIAEVVDTTACSGRPASRFFVVAALNPQPKEPQLRYDSKCRIPPMYSGYVPLPRPTYFYGGEIHIQSF